MRFLRWLTWRVWCRGEGWQYYAPREPGAYWQQERLGVRWSTPERVDCRVVGCRAIVEELVHIPRRDWRWRRWV